MNLLFTWKMEKAQVTAAITLPTVLYSLEISAHQFSTMLKKIVILVTILEKDIVILGEYRQSHKFAK